MEEAGLVFTQLKRAVQHNSENKFVEKLPSVSKKRLSRKKFKRHLLRAEQRNAGTQTLRSSFFDRIQSLKNSKYESELIKIVDCLLDGHGIIDNPCCTLKLENNKVFVLTCFKSSVYSKNRNLKSICLLNVEFSNNIFLLKVKIRTSDFSLKFKKVNKLRTKCATFFSLFLVLRYDFKQKTKILTIFKMKNFGSVLAA